MSNGTLAVKSLFKIEELAVAVFVFRADSTLCGRSEGCALDPRRTRQGVAAVLGGQACNPQQKRSMSI